jgi:hypothetical protein
MGQSIVGKIVDRGTKGTRAFVLADNTQVQYADALQAVASGNCAGLVSQMGPYGEFIKTEKDDTDSNNLDALPIHGTV